MPLTRQVLQLAKSDLNQGSFSSLRASRAAVATRTQQPAGGLEPQERPPRPPTRPDPTQAIRPNVSRALEDTPPGTRLQPPPRTASPGLTAARPAPRPSLVRLLVERLHVAGPAGLTLRRPGNTSSPPPLPTSCFRPQGPLSSAPAGQGARRPAFLPWSQ